MQKSMQRQTYPYPVYLQLQKQDGSIFESAKKLFTGAPKPGCLALFANMLHPLYVLLRDLDVSIRLTKVPFLLELEHSYQASGDIR